MPGRAGQGRAGDGCDRPGNPTSGAFVAAIGGLPDGSDPQYDATAKGAALEPTADLDRDHLVALARLGGRLRGRPLLGYGVAIAATGAALLVRLELDHLFAPGFPFLTFFPAILVTAFVCGAGPGAAAGVLSLLGAWYYLVPPAHSFAIARGALTPLVFFAFVFTVEVALVAVMQRALDRLSQAQAVSARLAETQRTLFQELQHRVANNMAFVSSMLRLQKRALTGDPAGAVAAFDDAVTRIETMGRVHRRLYDPAATSDGLDAHLAAICLELVEAAGKPQVRCRVSAPGFVLPLDRLLPLSLLVAEAVTNSLKHGLAGRATGTIAVTGHDNVIEVRDDGPGFGADGAPGLGTRIMQSLAAQAGARLERFSDGGAVTRIHLQP